MSEEIEFPRAMGNMDALLWRVESDPVLRSTTATVSLLDRPPDRERLTARIRRAVREIPRLRQRVVSLPRVLSTPVWGEDPNFDLGYHLRWIRAPRDGSLRALLDHCASLAMQGFDRTRPLWEFVVVEDLREGRAALLQKLHHSVTDGMAGVRLMQHVYDVYEAEEAGADPARESPEPLPGEPEDDEPVASGGEGAFWLGAEVLLRDLVRGPATARRGASRLLQMAAHPVQSTRENLESLASVTRALTPAVSPLSPILRGRSTRYHFDTLTFAVADLKLSAHAAGCKLNDAFLAAVAGGWRRYHERHGAEVEALRVMVPIDLRRRQHTWVAGNRLSLGRFVLPIADRDPVRRMQTVRELIASQRSERSLDYIESIAAAMRLLPDPVVVRAFGMLARHVDFIASCVPGPPVALSAAGARLERVFPFAPTAGAGTNVTLLSYSGEAGVTINTDAAAVPDPDVLLDCMREGFGEVLKVG